MRFLLVILLTGWVVAGCATRKSNLPAKPASGSAATVPAVSDANRLTVTNRGAVITLIQAKTGKVALFDSSAGFVVLDFADNPLPALDQKWGVYRQGQKVGEVKISGYARNQLIGADLIAGEAQKGDEVRPE